MDGQNQNTEPQPTQHTQPPRSTPQQPLPPRYNSRLAPIRSGVLQPSESFIAEMKDEAAQAETSPNQAATMNQGAVPSSATPPNPNLPPASSIYPEPTHDSVLSSPQDPNALAEPAKEKLGKNNKTEIIITLVTILGGYTVISALLSIVNSGAALTYGFVSKGSGFLTVFAVVYLLIGVGLVLRKNIARVAYVLLAIIGLGFSFYGTYQLHKAISLYNSASVSEVATDKNDIVQIQNNTFFTAAQKQDLIRQDQQDIATANKPGTYNKFYFGLIQGYVLAILPLVFLTRRSVKEVFS